MMSFSMKSRFPISCIRVHGLAIESLTALRRKSTTSRPWLRKIMSSSAIQLQIIQFFPKPSILSACTCDTLGSELLECTKRHTFFTRLHTKERDELVQELRRIVFLDVHHDTGNVNDVVCPNKMFRYWLRHIQKIQAHIFRELILGRKVCARDVETVELGIL
ncbi:unnamed protein product [Periconia digitata]|uniref:Uncharacterized protein n=1 Tax=Periconia digitata TaxID=1303443 RepID=A0A9W4XD35_9PLEO|nr:unnamed protein product [Periconia digitata]